MQGVFCKDSGVLTVYKQTTHLGAFGADSAKPIVVWSNSQLVAELYQPRPRGLRNPEMAPHACVFGNARCKSPLKRFAWQPVALCCVNPFTSGTC